MGDQVCTKAILPGMLHNRVVLSCNAKSIRVAHFQDNGVHDAELFGGFANGEVWLVDRWGNGEGQVEAAPAHKTEQRIFCDLNQTRL